MTENFCIFCMKSDNGVWVGRVSVINALIPLINVRFVMQIKLNLIAFQYHIELALRIWVLFLIYNTDL